MLGDNILYSHDLSDRESVNVTKRKLTLITTGALRVMGYSGKLMTWHVHCFSHRLHPTTNFEWNTLYGSFGEGEGGDQGGDSGCILLALFWIIGNTKITCFIGAARFSERRELYFLHSFTQSAFRTQTFWITICSE